MSSKLNWVEIKIPVPWGEVAGKWWGSRTQKPILALHGWQDSCGTFDTLIPLLPKHISFLAIDFPGHGFSTPLPIGNYYCNSMTFAILVRRIQQYFGWKKVSLMGHSMGGGVSFIFASSFPQNVDFIVLIDFLKPLIYEDIIKKRGKAIDKFLEYDRFLEEGIEPPSYTIEDLKRRYCEGVFRSVDLDHVHYILERNVRPSKCNPQKFYLARDPRQKVGVLFNYPREELKEAAERLTMPIFLSKGEDSPALERKEYFEEVLGVVQKMSSDFKCYYVPGTHHHHLNNPESISELLSDFLNKYYKPERNDLTNKL